MTPSGAGLVETRRRSVLVRPEDLGVALEGDEVEVTVAAAGGYRAVGRVLRVVSRAPRRVCGVVEQRRWLVPDDVRLGRRLRCLGWMPRAQPRPMVWGGELLSEPDDRTPDVQIARCFGRRGDAHAELMALLWREQLDEVFPEGVLREASRYAEGIDHFDDADRMDLRSIDFLTVGPDAACDRADALFAERRPDGRIRLLIAVVDVGAFVKPGSMLDIEACRRSASLYLPVRSVPMLPPVISSHAASFLPNADRPAIVVEVWLDETTRVCSHHIMLAMIRSRRSLTYHEVGGALRRARNARGAFAGAETVVVLDELAPVLRRRRNARGAVAFKTPEMLVAMNDLTGIPASLTWAEHDPWTARAHGLVEEPMLLVNELAASTLQHSHAKTVADHCEGTWDAHLLGVVEATRLRVGRLHTDVELHPRALRGLLSSIDDHRARSDVTSALIDAMPTAPGAAYRQDHVVQPSPGYARCTAPTQRYADLFVQRVVRAQLLGKSPDRGPLSIGSVAFYQRRARSIQREVGSLCAALMMQEQTGKTYPGTVLRVLQRAWVVALDDPSICVRCARPATVVTEGARVRVRIDAIDIARREAHAVFVGTLTD